MKKSIIILSIALFAVFISCTSGHKAAHADWTYNSVVYELNVRQYTPEGTFRAAEAEFPRLKKLGVDVIWLMPIYPIGEKERKGSLGSYYAVRDYCAVNPEFGNMSDFDSFLSKAHDFGFKVILDWVANHTSPDAVWNNESGYDWYMRDSLGNTVVNYDWYDIAELNYDNPKVWIAMEDAMRFWLDKGVDGFRCDMAHEIPVEFWRRVLPKLRSEYDDVYFLAEAENTDIVTGAFDACYSWELLHLGEAIARGEKGVKDLLAYLEKDASQMPREAFRLMFTSNHDENSWAGTEFERYGDAWQVMAVLSFTLPGGQPMLYTGQEMGWNHRFQFFEKDPVPAWEENEYSDFYKKLITLRHDNPALASGERRGDFKVISTDDETLVFTRTSGNNTVTVTAQLKSPWAWDIKTNQL